MPDEYGDELEYDVIIDAGTREAADFNAKWLNPPRPIEQAIIRRRNDRVDVSDDFGDVTVPFELTITNAQLAEELLAYICPAGEPWTADTPEIDHGHTKCMWIGLAIQRLRATTA